MPDLSRMKLGRRAIKIDSRTVKLSPYLVSLPNPPAARDWTAGVTSYGEMLNDQLGDCTIAGCGHAIQTWSVNQGSETTVPDSAILSCYEQWDGYNPLDPSTDQGGIELDVLTDWKNSSLSGHILSGFASVQPANLRHVKQAIEIFGGVYIGVTLPVSAQNQSVWQVVPDDGGVWGGHCVWVPKYDENGFTCITWGALQPMTNSFWSKYVDECYCLLSPDWIGAKGTPDGLDLAQLEADIGEIN